MNIIHKPNLNRVAYRRLCYLLVVGLAIILVIIIQFEAYKYVRSPKKSPKESVPNEDVISLITYLDTDETLSSSK